MAKLQSYAMSVALTKLKHSIITAKSGQKCLVIPIDDNYLTHKEHAVYMQTDIVTMDSEDTNGNWGFQVQKLPSEIYKKLGADTAKEIKLPYFGNLKVFQKSNGNDSAGAVDVPIDEEEDLPF
jgi:hypothetical protein